MKGYSAHCIITQKLEIHPSISKKEYIKHVFFLLISKFQSAVARLELSQMFWDQSIYPFLERDCQIWTLVQRSHFKIVHRASCEFAHSLQTWSVLWLPYKFLKPRRHDRHLHTSVYRSSTPRAQVSHCIAAERLPMLLSWLMQMDPGWIHGCYLYQSNDATSLHTHTHTEECPAMHHCEH